jgi:hypothetical protein
LRAELLYEFDELGLRVGESEILHPIRRALVIPRRRNVKLFRLSSRTTVVLLGVFEAYCGRSENVFCGSGWGSCDEGFGDSTAKTLIARGFPRSSTTTSPFVKSATGPFLSRTMTST